jgi:uncharacterized protein (TIGR02145 family)
MKRLFLLLSFLMMCVCAVMAQAPEKMTYQAVVRNSGNSLVANQNVSVRLSILQGSAQGAPVYVENHTATTNDNGLMTVVIGGGAPTTGVFANIDWANGPYFLKSEIDPTGGISYSIESVQQLMSVPYALYAKEAGNGFSGDYNDLTNRPQIPQVPTNVSAFTNDAGYITMDSVPAIPTVPTNVSAFTNDAGYLTSFTESQILSISNDTIYLTGGSFVKLPAGFDGDYNSLTNKPNLAPVATTGSYNDMTGKPNLAPVATSGEYNDLTGKPNLAPVATSGNYNDLTNRPQIPQVPTNVSAFTNDAGYITMDSVPAIPTVPTNVSAFTNDAGYLTSFTESQILSISNDTIYLTGGSFVKLPAGFDGDYNSLTNKPNLAPVATTGSYNDITGKPNLAPVATSGEYNDLTGKPNLAPVATSGNYNDLTNRPQIPTVPTNVSAFQNDAGYITRDSIPAGLAGSQTGDIMYWDAGTNTWIMMPAGTSGQVLTMENGVPRWASLPDYVTMNLPPTVTTTVPSEVTQSSVLCGGVVTSDGSVQLTACGVCWSTHHFPTIADAHTENDLGVSAFTSHVTNLAHHTTYYVRAYATNSVGTSYGAEMTFTTTDIPTDSLMMPNPCSSTDTNTVAQPTLGPNYLVCAGTDSVELSLGNYQYGSIQWQYSLDTISWFDIPNAFDEQLVYKPEQTQFVRAEVSYANCPPEHSEVKLLQKTPAANAGISRTANIGDTLHLQANMEENATGSWQILQGANGLLKTPTEAASKFYGTDSLYRLRWTLTNSCGTSSDDINVRYVRPKVSSKVVVVDTTDIIFSDSAQLAHGYYVISFSDSNIVIGDSTILVSLVNGGFLRKVDSWSMANDSTYAMYTTQATLYDILESGVINFGGISGGDNEGGSTAENAVENTPAQDSPDQATPEPDTQTRGVEFLDHIPTRKELREHPEMDNKMYVLGMDIYREDGSGETLMSEPRTRGGATDGMSNEAFSYDGNQIRFTIPNYSNGGISLENATLTMNPATPVLDYIANTRNLNFGFSNTQLNMTADLVLDGVSSLSGFNLPPIEGTIKAVYYRNGMPVSCFLKCSINFQIDGSVSIAGNIRHKITASANFNWTNNFALNDWNPSVPLSNEKYNYGKTDIELVSDYSPITADLNLSLGACQNFILYGVEGPHTEVGCMATMKYLNHNMGSQGVLSSDLYVKADLGGAYSVIDDVILENWSDNFSSSKNSDNKWYSFSTRKWYPYKMQTTNDKQYQTIQAGGQTVSVEVMVLGNDNKPMKNINVYFEPQDGGQVSQSMVTTNQIGNAQTQWTTGEASTLTHQLKAYVYDGTGQPIEGSPLVFTAYEGVSQPQAHNCGNSTLQLIIKDKKDALFLVPQNGDSPYTYYMDWHNIGTEDGLNILFDPAPGNHEFMVADANGCVATKSYKVEGLIDCSLSDLRLNERVEGNTITLTGLNGKSPYTYSLGGITYSENNVFSSLSPRTYTAYVMDDNRCVKSMEITIIAGSSNSQGVTPCAGAATVTDYDGNVYPTLKIGNQCWMAENLRTEHYADGEAVGIGSGCFYPNNNSGNKSRYGLLYTLHAATRGGTQGVCPNGWHVPSDAEWTQLTNRPQVVAYPAKALATKEGWNSSTTQSTPGCDSYNNNGIGFNAAPAGQYYNGYKDFGAVAWFWSTTYHYINGDNCGTYNRSLRYDAAGVGRDYYSRNGASGDGAHAYSIRCLRDN